MKSTSEFRLKQRSKDRLDSRCRACAKRYEREKYSSTRSDRKRVSDRIKANRAEKYTIVSDLLKRSCCTDCGESDPIVLEFDHVRGEKYLCVSKMVADGYALARIEDEIAKCDIVCANCHRRRTARVFWNTDNPKVQDD